MKLVNKDSVLFFTLLISLSGCIRKEGPKPNKQSQQDMSMVDMGMEEDVVADINNFFDPNELSQEDPEQVMAWVEQDESNYDFKPLYFEYDHQKPMADQSDRLSFNAERAAELLSRAREQGRDAKIVIEGHACSAGKASAAYKVALSEKRAKQVADALVAYGIDPQDIKIVGLGNAVPATLNGEPVMGSAEEQALNRRVEMHIMYS